jgi:hypothetical protein
MRLSVSQCWKLTIAGAATDHIALEDGGNAIGGGLGFTHYGLEGGGGDKTRLLVWMSFVLFG